MSDPSDGGREANRALGSLLAVAAHELSSPMTGVLAFARYAAQHSDPQSRVHELLVDIEREALRCTATIQDLLMFSRVAGLEEPTTAQLGEVVERALAELAAPIERQHIQISVEISPDTPRLRVQALCLQRALVSLLASAIDALAASRVASPHIALGAAPDADGVLLSLTDNGRGPEPQEGGARIGQSLARAVVRAQGGTLSLHERAEELRVRIWLPAVS